MTREQRLEGVVKEILYRSMTTENGGYVSHFGPVLCGEMIKLTGFDISKREINETS